MEGHSHQTLKLSKLRQLQSTPVTHWLRLSSAGLVVVWVPGCCSAYSAFSVQHAGNLVMTTVAHRRQLPLMRPFLARCVSKCFPPQSFRSISGACSSRMGVDQSQATPRLGEVRAPEGRASADDTAQDEQLQRSSSRKTLVGLQSASQIWDNPAKRLSQAAFPIHVTHGPWVQRIPVGPARVTYHRTVVRGVTAGEARGQRVFGRSEVAVSSVFIDTCLAPNPGSWSVLINMCMIGHRAGPPRSLTRLRMPLHCKKNMCPVCCHLSLR